MSDKFPWSGLVKALLLSNIVSIVLFGLRVVATHSTVYWFLFWNLLLAWVPVLFSWLLMRRLKHHSWKEPLSVVLTMLWLVFLPNSFYIISDLIHLEHTGDIGLLFDAVLFVSCIWNGILAGMLSIVWVHRALVKRKSPVVVSSLVAGVFALTSFAIYLGRTLRWNTWDVLVHPPAVLFDVSEQVINPLAHPEVLVTTLTFFILLSSIYLVVWQFVGMLDYSARKTKPPF